VRHEKVEAGALCVGYRSTKNFYSAFRELSGMTATGFRRLPTERAEAILNSPSWRWSDINGHSVDCTARLPNELH
jgi:hypothetical protein